jgi:hypothetical protein
MVLKHLHKTRTGDMRIGLTLFSVKTTNPGKAGFQIWELCLMGKHFIISKMPFPDSGKVQYFDMESKEIIKGIADLEIEHGFMDKTSKQPPPKVVALRGRPLKEA